MKIWHLRYLMFLSLILIIHSSCSSGSGTDNEVLVCLSEDAYAYHSSECLGFNQCDSDSEWISIEEAKEEGRTPCGFCY